jgi:hypothetical protein
LPGLNRFTVRIFSWCIIKLSTRQSPALSNIYLTIPQFNKTCYVLFAKHRCVVKVGQSNYKPLLTNTVCNCVIPYLVFH